MTKLNTGALPEALWRSRLGASSVSASLPGTSVPAAGIGTGPCAATVLPVLRVRDHVAFAVPATQQAAPAVQFGQTNAYNYMTSVDAVGVGAAGPPRYREPV